ncbi:4a-hydroxytetrahydrobiopterin dehydratase [Candidatus Micrarchaeota archaeon]|nr:4a-hydroxytetrahydrobiopterin dehydratase [Candidatus Micrarchaeota archaeon]
MQYIRLNEYEISENLKKLNSWQILEGRLTKEFEFKTFKEAISFVNKVADLADQINHHPDITINFTKVRLSVTTHFTKCLTNKDFELAEKTDCILQI